VLLRQGYTEVILTTRFGAFVDVGTERGIFLPYSEMIEPVHPISSWPNLITVFMLLLCKNPIHRSLVIIKIPCRVML